MLLSAALGRPQANIAVPVYSDDNSGTLVGIWGCGLNLTMLSNLLQSLNLADGERVLYVDRNGQRIADSSSELSLESAASHEPIADLQSFKNTINGESGSVTQIVNGTMMVVSYHPVETFSNVWAVLYMEPYSATDVGNSNHNAYLLSS